MALPAWFASTEQAATTAVQNVGNPITDLLVSILPEGIPFWMITLMGAGAAFGATMGFITVVVMFSVWLERKAAGHIHVRLGPMRVGGWHGWAQTIADGVKLLMKEDLAPLGSDKVLFKMAPMLVLGSAIAAFVALPLGPGVKVAEVDLGVFFMISIFAISTIGVIMAGWGSNNKWSVYGAMREAAQVASYEIPLGLSLMAPVMAHGTFSLTTATEAQTGFWYAFGPDMWIAWPAFFLFFTAALAETKRAPFDLPESESELVAGFHTEYSGMRFSFFFLEEYAAMFLMSGVGVAFWFGGWNPLPFLPIPEDPGLIWTLVGVGAFVVKSLILVFVMMWVRWTVPRLRIDQVMTLGYKYLIPITLLLIFVAATWEYVKFALGGSA